MPFHLKKETHHHKPAYRIYETTGDSVDSLVDENYYRFVMTPGTQAKAIFALFVDNEPHYFMFNKAKGKMRSIPVGTFERSIWRKMAQEPKEFRQISSKGFGSRGLKKPVRLWHVKGSNQAAKAIEAHRQKVEAGLATMSDLSIEIVDQETLTMAQGALTRGQSFVFLPQQEDEPVKDNVLLKTPSLLYGKTCRKYCVETVSKGKNPLVQKNENAFSFSGTQLAMSSCNAFTHAVENGFEDGKTPKHSWEWLHVRGKQMGGDFSPDNLVAGTYHGNSSMIEFENALTAHARFFAANAEPGWVFNVTWGSFCEPANSHIGKWILIEWDVNYAGADTAEFLSGAEYKLFTKSGRYAFDPLRGAIWTANEGAALLRVCRDGV